MPCTVEDTVKHVKFLAQALGVCDPSCVVIAALMDLGIPPNCDGFDYLERAIMLEYEGKLLTLAGDIYPQIAREYDNRVDGEIIDTCMRNAIKSAWDHRDDDVWKKYFPGFLRKRKKKLTNAQFISGIVKFTTLWYRLAVSYERKRVREEVGNGIE